MQEESRIGVVSVVSDSFTEYFLVLLYSIRKHNPWFQPELVIIWSQTLSPLSDENKAKIRRAYPRVSFHQSEEAKYLRYSPDPRFCAALLKIECFRFAQFDRVIFLDSDMLCLGDIRFLFTVDAPFVASPAGKNREAKEQRAGKFRLGQGFNSGVMVIGKKYLGERVYKKILRAKPGPHADQEILHVFFRFRFVCCLDHHYNYNAKFFWTGEEKDVRILHYAGEKPLELPNEPRMKIWFEYRDEMLRGPAHMSS